jgi:hypothetical protein
MFTNEFHFAVQIYNLKSLVVSDFKGNGTKKLLIRIMGGGWAWRVGLKRWLLHSFDFAFGWLVRKQAKANVCNVRWH